MDPNPGRVGLRGTVERGFEPCGRDVVAAGVEALLVEAADPGEGLVLSLVDVVSHRGTVRVSDARSLVGPVVVSARVDAVAADPGGADRSSHQAAWRSSRTPNDVYVTRGSPNYVARPVDR